jgi:hypothetical protein
MFAPPAQAGQGTSLGGRQLLGQRKEHQAETR